jgi:hypothetical protein
MFYIDRTRQFYECKPNGFHTKSTFALFIFFVTQKKEKNRRKQNKTDSFFFKRLANGNITTTTMTTKEEEVNLLHLDVLSKTNIIYET